MGTRPEAIKLLPVLRELGRHKAVIRTLVVSTGQHRQILKQVVGPWRVKVDYDMRLMRPDQSLYSLSARAIAGFERTLAKYRPDMVLVQGDTTTAFVAAFCAAYAKIPVGHVEAGLRTGNRRFPFPEELNRCLISTLAELHFAPTASSRENLLREGVPASKIFVTGNTAVDSLLACLEELRRNSRKGISAPPNSRLVLVTLHRREIFGERLKELLHAVRELALSTPNLFVLFPVHPNPNVRKPARKVLGDLPNVRLAEPLDHFQFIDAMLRSQLILTDSGGIQEEAPTIGVPVLVLRERTERPEALENGSVKLAGTDREAIVREARRLLADNPGSVKRSAVNPYGDGRAAARIAKQVLRFLGVSDKGIYSTLAEFSPGASRAAGSQD